MKQKLWIVHKIEGAPFQYENNHYTKFEYKGMKILELQITQTRPPLSILDRLMSEFNTNQNLGKKSWNVHNKRGAHLQYENFHYTKFE